MTQDRIDLVGRVFVGDEVMLHTIHGGPEGLLRVVGITRTQVKTEDGRRWRLSDGVRAWRRADHPETEWITVIGPEDRQIFEEEGAYELRRKFAQMRRRVPESSDGVSPYKYGDKAILMDGGQLPRCVRVARVEASLVVTVDGGRKFLPTGEEWLPPGAKRARGVLLPASQGLLDAVERIGLIDEIVRALPGMRLEDLRDVANLLG